MKPTFLRQSFLFLSCVLVLFSLSMIYIPAKPSSRLLAQSCTPMDIVLAIDTTASMTGAIDNVKAEAAELVDRIVAISQGNYQMGLVEFRDNIVILTDLAPNTADTIRAQIGGLTASGGDFIAEASDETLNTVINRLSADGRPQSGNFNGSWRDDANKIIILITDAPPGGFDDNYVEGIDNVNANQRAIEARDRGIRIAAVYVPTREDVASADAAGINGVTDLSADIAEAVMRNYREVTDGAFIKTAATGEGTAMAISRTVERCARDFEDDFTEPPVTVPEPITIVLFGTGVAGLAGYMRNKRKQNLE